MVKRKSGFAANLLMGILTGTAFIYRTSYRYGHHHFGFFEPLSDSFRNNRGNVLRDILSMDGDSKVGYPTLPQKIGAISAAKVGGIFFLLTGILAPYLPYLSS